MQFPLPLLLDVSAFLHHCLSLPPTPCSPSVHGQIRQMDSLTSRKDYTSRGPLPRPFSLQEGKQVQFQLLVCPEASAPVTWT